MGKGWKACPARGRNLLHAVQIYLVQIYTILKCGFLGRLNTLQMCHKSVLNIRLFISGSGLQGKGPAPTPVTPRAEPIHNIRHSNWITISIFFNLITWNTADQQVNITTGARMLSLMGVMYQHKTGKSSIKKKCICGTWQFWFLICFFLIVSILLSFIREPGL